MRILASVCHRAKNDPGSWHCHAPGVDMVRRDLLPVTCFLHSLGFCSRRLLRSFSALADFWALSDTDAAQQHRDGRRAANWRFQRCAPLFRLHCRHRMRRFSDAHEPPLEKGTMWSNSRSSVDPHSTHLPPSRIHTSDITSFDSRDRLRSCKDSRCSAVGAGTPVEAN